MRIPLRRSLLFGSRSFVATTLPKFLGNVFALAVISAYALEATARAAVVSVDAITIAPGEVLRVDSLAAPADAPVPPSGIVIDTSALNIGPGGVLDWKKLVEDGSMLAMSLFVLAMAVRNRRKTV